LSVRVRHNGEQDVFLLCNLQFLLCNLQCNWAGIVTTDSPPTRSRFGRLAGLLRFRLAWLLAAVTVIAIVLAVIFHREPIGRDNLSRLARLNEIERDVFRLVWSDDRTRAAFVGWETPVDIRETITLWPVRTVGEGKKIIEFAFSPDPDLVAWTENQRPVVIQRAGAKALVTLDTGTDQCDLDFSPDGTLLATGGYERGAMVWNVADGTLRHQLDMGTVQGGLTVRFSPDGKVLAVGNRNSSARLFDAKTGQVLHQLQRNSSHELAFHPTGKKLAIAYVDGTVVVWDVSTGQALSEAKPGAEEIYALDWSPDGKLLVSSGLNSDICLWDEHLDLLHRLPAPKWVISAKFSPDGTRLITGGGGSTPGSRRSITVWGVPHALLP
jgi:WD40 repeat protein